MAGLLLLPTIILLHVNAIKKKNYYQLIIIIIIASDLVVLKTEPLILKYTNVLSGTFYSRTN